MKVPFSSYPKFINTELLAALSIVVLTSLAQASDITWKNDGHTSFFDGASWNGAIAPGSGDIADFNALFSSGQPNLLTSGTISGLYFSTTTSSGYNITSADSNTKLYLNSTSSASGTAAITALNTSGTNTISAPIVLNAAANGTQNVIQAAGGTLILNDISSTNSINLVLNKSQTASTIILNGASTYHGTVTLNGGGSGSNLAQIGISGVNPFSDAAVKLGSLGTTLFLTNPGLDLTGANKISNSIAYNANPNSKLTISGNNVSIEFGGNIDLGGAGHGFAILTGTGSAGGGADTVTFSGVISNDGGGGFKFDSAVTGSKYYLTNTNNSYSGPTNLSGGIVSVSSIGNSGNNSVLGKSGSIKIGQGTLLYTGLGETTDKSLFFDQSSTLAAVVEQDGIGILRFTADPTFAGSNAVGGNLTLQGSGTGQLSGNYANSTVAGAGAFGITKAGTGTWILDGTNTYTSSTTVGGGVLRLNSASALPGGTGTTGGTSLLKLNGGVIGLGTADFTRSIGSSGSSVQWVGGGAGGGFAAYGADRIVNLSGTGATVTWGATNSIPVSGALMFGASDADKTVTFQNPIALGNATSNVTRTIQVTKGLAPVDAILSGSISDGGNSSNNGITKTGDGTLMMSAVNTYTGATNIVAGKLVITGALGATAVAVGDGTTNARTPTLAGNGTIAGLVTTSVGVGNIAHVAPGATTGTVGTLTLSGGLTIGAGTNMDLDLNTSTAAGGMSNDLISLNNTGALTLGNSITINYNALSSLTTGSAYTLVNGATGITNLTGVTFTSTGLTGMTANYSIGGSGTNQTLLVTFTSTGGGATPTTYTLTTTAGSTNILTGGTTVITSVVTNTGSGTADTLNYSGLGATSGAGGSVGGSTASGGPLAQGASGTNTGQVFTGTQSGAVVVSPVGTGSNATAGGTATAGGSTSVTVNVFDPASLSGVQSGTGTMVAVTALNQSGTFRASAKVTADNGLANNQGFTNVAVAPGTQINSGSSVTVASFDKTNRLNGIYTATKSLGYDNVTSSGSAITGGTGNTANVGLSVSISGQSAGAGQTFSAALFSGQKYGTTTGSTSSGYGLMSNIEGDTHSPTTATLINGAASANTTVTMSFNTVPSAGTGHDTSFRTSDILSLGGIVTTGGTNADGSILTDKYVLQLSYDSSAVGAQYIGWYDAAQGQWVNAIAGNSTGTGLYFRSGEFAGSYADYLATLVAGGHDTDLAFQLNAFGYDASTHTAWAVLDHNSEFAVIPEPGTWGMILSGFGMLIGIQRLRRRRVGI